MLHGWSLFRTDQLARCDSELPTSFLFFFPFLSVVFSWGIQIPQEIVVMDGGMQ